MVKLKAPRLFMLDEMTIKEIILARLEDLGVSKYDLAHYGDVDAAPSTIFRFLSSDSNSSTVSTNVEQMLASCGLALVSVFEPEWIMDEEEY